MTEFLTLDEILGIHVDQIDRYGGSPGIRDLRLLESAMSMPEAGFGGEMMHPTIFEQAAAYLFHLCKNHPFVDGNKRVALAACLAFLSLNGFDVEATEDELVELVIGVAAEDVLKAEVAVFLQKHARST
jgi:death-on-curing protein